MHWIIRFPLVAVILVLLSSCVQVPDLEKLTRPRFQTGGTKGAAYCGSCHPVAYQQWSQYSRHAKATKSRAFRRAVAELKDHIVLGGIVDEDMCYSCHGDKKINEGINCESCHGSVLPGVTFDVTHEVKFRPRLKEMRKPGFCARCHQVKAPLTGEPLTTLHDEWKQSPAARKGLTCQGCHMAKRADDPYAYHGFRTAVRNPLLYRNKLKIGKIALNAKRLRLMLENRVKGHSIPAGGPTRVLALELELKDGNGKIVHRDVRRFFKHFSMLPVVGGVPFMQINNTQLRSGENRHIRFNLPDGAYAASAKLTLLLRMFEVADKHEGRIRKAHWASRPIFRKTIAISHSKLRKKR